MVGNTIPVRLDDKQEIRATIIKIFFESFALSYTMIMLLDASSLGLEDDMVLELFDRRFAAQLGEEHKIDPWTMDTEQQYCRFGADGSADIVGSMLLLTRYATMP